jgi:hypothetical protein
VHYSVSAARRREASNAEIMIDPHLLIFEGGCAVLCGLLATGNAAVHVRMSSYTASTSPTRHRFKRTAGAAATSRYATAQKRNERTGILCL